MHDEKLIWYFKKLGIKSLRYKCAFTQTWIYDYESNDKVDHMIFVISYYNDTICYIICIDRLDINMYLSMDFRFLFLLNTVKKMKKHLTKKYLNKKLN